jgi:ATP-dependent DNA helicase RecQ
LQADLTLAELGIKDWGLALSSALLYLDTNEVLHLARGKAVFRAAMNIELNPEARRRQFRKSDYAELALHYKDKVVQVHVMAEYAKLAVQKVQAAMAFIVDYFSLDRAAFVRRYFAGRKDVLEMATTEAAHRKILTDLANPDQQAIVAAHQEGNYLVLAGPGAGKTRVIVHRVAWLLRECMVLPEEIMVLAYNRSAAVEIRRRLWALVGQRRGRCHGADPARPGHAPHRHQLRRGGGAGRNGGLRPGDPPGHRTPAAPRSRVMASGRRSMRDRLLAGLRFLLVDEYQDINGDHYALISALAGRTIQTEEDRLSLMVVGDDDQNIYAFDGANVRYIRQFEADYQARRFSLVENYRSTAHIIHCANRVIAPARERMKAGQEIRVDHARRGQPEGGAQAALDPLAAGRVQVLEVPRDLHREVCIALAELKRLHTLDRARGTASWGGFAVIARRWEDLEPMAALCRQHHIPVQLLRDGSARTCTSPGKATRCSNCCAVPGAGWHGGAWCFVPAPSGAGSGVAMARRWTAPSPTPSRRPWPSSFSIPSPPRRVASGWWGISSTPSTSLGRAGVPRPGAPKRAPGA